MNSDEIQNRRETTRIGGDDVYREEREEREHKKTERDTGKKGEKSGGFGVKRAGAKTYFIINFFCF